MYLPIYVFISSFVHSFVHSFIHSFVRSFVPTLFHTFLPQKMLSARTGSVIDVTIAAKGILSKSSLVLGIFHLKDETTQRMATFLTSKRSWFCSHGGETAWRNPLDKWLIDLICIRNYLFQGPSTALHFKLQQPAWIFQWISYLLGNQVILKPQIVFSWFWKNEIWFGSQRPLKK